MLMLHLLLLLASPRFFLRLERLLFQRPPGFPAPALFFVLRTSLGKARVFPYGYVDRVRMTQATMSEQHLHYRSAHIIFPVLVFQFEVDGGFLPPCSGARAHALD